MSEPSQSSRYSHFAACIFFICGLSQAQPTYKGLENDRSSDHKHGLFEIQRSAAEFIIDFNREHRTNYRALDPDLRIQVPRCAASLRVTWLRDVRFVADGKSAVQKRLAVTCRRTVPGSPTKTWSVDVPVFQPSPQ